MVEERDGDGPTVINQPAGHLEDNESLLAAVRREVMEETGWAFDPQGLVGVYKWRLPDKGLTYVRYCFWGAGSQRYDRPPDSEILRTLWLTGSEILDRPQRHRSPMVAHCLRDYLAGRRFELELINEIN